MLSHIPLLGQPISNGFELPIQPLVWIGLCVTAFAPLLVLILRSILGAESVHIKPVRVDLGFGTERIHRNVPSASGVPDLRICRRQAA